MTPRDRGARLGELIAEINREHEACETAYQAALGHAFRAGELLIEAKSHIPHGSWGPWLARNFKGSERTARRYVQLAENRSRVADLPSVTEALAELATPREAEPADTDTVVTGEVVEDARQAPARPPAASNYRHERRKLRELLEQHVLPRLGRDFEEVGPFGQSIILDEVAYRLEQAAGQVREWASSLREDARGR